MQQYMNEIKNLVSCPAKIYNLLYVSTLNNFIQLCPLELKISRLQLAIIALKIRLGMLFPKNAGAEIIAAEEPQWTYAIFSACLLKDFNHELINQIIPEIAINWLQSNIFLFNQWEGFLRNQIDDKNDFQKVINSALSYL